MRVLGLADSQRHTRFVCCIGLRSAPYEGRLPVLAHKREASTLTEHSLMPPRTPKGKKGGKETRLKLLRTSLKLINHTNQTGWYLL